jgi:hypothetical protein
VLRINGQWQKYSTDKILSASEDNSSRMVIDRNGIKWLGTNRDGVIGFDVELFLKNHCWTRYGNLPISDVRSVAIDTKTNFG